MNALIRNNILIGNNSVRTSVSEEENSIVASFRVDQNYPNPFSPETVISCSVKTSCLVTLKIFDLLGREITILVEEIKNPGTYSAKFSIVNNDLVSGIYFYRFTAGNFVQSKKMILMK